jgi:transposase-like protein
MGKRKRYTAEEKVKILREVIEDGKQVSQVAEQYGLHPNNIFNWRKQLFEGGVQTFQIKRSDISGKAEERKITALEEKIKQKDEAIAKLAEESSWDKKKELWPSIGKAKMGLEGREIAKKEIARLRSRTGIPLETLLGYAGIPQRTWREGASGQALGQSTTTTSQRHFT